MDRCDDKTDWVRKEIEYAIENNKNIIPVMSRDFSWPDNLCDELEELPYYQGVKVLTDYWEAALDKICSLFVNSTINEDDLYLDETGRLKKVIKYEDYTKWKYDEEWTTSLLEPTENRWLWKSRVLYTGQRKIVVKEEEKTIIKYKQLDKWVTNQKALGEYIYNIKTFHQYKYAYRCVNRIYIGKSFYVPLEYNNAENNCENIIRRIDNNEYNKIKEIDNLSEEDGGYEFSEFYFQFNKKENIEIKNANVIIYNGKIELNRLGEFKEICNSLYNENDMIIFFSWGISENAMDSFAQFERMIPIVVRDLDYLNDLCRYIGIDLPNNNSFADCSIYKIIFYNDNIKIYGLGDCDIRVNYWMDRLKEIYETSDESKKNKYQNRINKLLHSINQQI